MVVIKRVLRYFFIFGIFSNYVSCNIVKKTNEKEQQVSSLKVYYSFLDTANPLDNNLPSSCDCDYKKIGLSIMKDSSFTLREQKGRLKIISLKSTYGTWKVDSNTLQLELDSIITKINQFDPIKNILPYRVYRMEIVKNKLIDENGREFIRQGKGFLDKS